MASAITSAANTATPVRRISRKAHQNSDSNIAETECEKTAPYITTSDSPFLNASNAPPQTSDLPHSQVKQFLAGSSIESESDVEAQHTARFKRTNWKKRVVAYLVLALAIFVWLMLIVGVLVMTDNFIPGALRSYQVLKDMGAELANAKFEVAGLKAQVATLWQYVNQKHSFQKTEE
ncbi:uncharacterized protein K460DRAFT_354965 [Cucurbitaria berberidis CBS 394.84]|uniref:Uncharacterized protein n=1 Tax=Cucurbitaria berberidis CBS 394.84 TaxID=1168544 RepID=A0A9P4GGP0_9PLEO|nr:uncharacterized protein K460DRAFT_354965 [Cucurbitaria berberidis CBS 394.84]KAF1845114.1 hypothetical protein K460DRAFT_354965 [Cucurbitaria berberidis CBS 394.84]